MTLKPPSNMLDAIPTTRGWINPRNGDIVKSQKIAVADVKAFYEEKSSKKIKEAVVIEVIEQEPEVLPDPGPTLDEIEVIVEEEEAVDLAELEKMTKSKLVEWAAEQNIELDSSLTKAQMIEQLKT